MNVSGGVEKTVTDALKLQLTADVSSEKALFNIGLL